MSNSRSSFAVCRFGGLVHGHDGDEQRANRLSNGSVGCIFCGVRGPSTFDALLNANGDNSSTLTRVESRLDYRFSGCIKRGVAWSSVVFESPKQFDDSLEIGTDFGEEYRTPPAAAKLPECIDKVALALSSIGYRVTGSNATNTGGTIIMVLGKWQTPERKFLDGVRVELSWVY